MKTLFLATCASALLAFAAHAQQAPSTVDGVANPGGALPGNPQIALVKVADGFLDPINVANAGDGSGRIFVVERAGRIKIVNKDGSVNADPFLDLTSINPLGNDVQTGFVEQGLYAVAFHPDFANNGHFYVHYASLPFNGDGMIVRFTVDPASPDVVDADRTNATAKVIMRIEQPWYNHNGGQIEFGPDGMLYIGSGDGGWEGDPYEAGQDLSTPLGKILRINVDVEDDSIPYTIPADNPFASASAERLMVLFGITEEQFSKIKTRSLPEIWSYGVRNPYEFAFDPANGNMFIADVGQNHWEEILFEKAGEGGHNYGWPRMEASFCHPMTGVSLAGDWCSGRVFGLGWDGSKWQLQEMMQTGLQFTAGGYDEDGMVLAVNANNFYLADEGPDTNPPGQLWRVMAAGDVPAGAEVAATTK
jgi:glucose/arabinose dehydrogenase